MQNQRSFTGQFSPFEENIFTFDQDISDTESNIESSQPNFSGKQTPTFPTQSNHQNPEPLQTQIFTFDQDDLDLPQNPSTNYPNPAPSHSLQNTISQQTQGNDHLDEDLTLLKNQILFKPLNNYLTKKTPSKNQSSLKKPFPSNSKPQVLTKTLEEKVITKSFEEKVKQLKESLKENNIKEPTFQKKPSKQAELQKKQSDRNSIKQKIAQAQNRRSNNSVNSKSNEDSGYDAFKEIKAEELLKPKYEIHGAKIVSEDVASQQFEYVEEQKAIKVTNLRQFLFTQLAQQYKVNALITRVEDGGFLGKLVSKTRYLITIEENNKFLFSVTKDGFNKFIFSLAKQNFSHKSKNYLGQLLSKDYSNSQFVLYDNGFDPKQTKCLEYCFKQMASIKYEETSGPRKFSVILSTNSKGFHTIESEVDVLEQKWSEKKERKNLCKLYSKEPEFDEIDGNYKLDFKGMAGKASVKNFVLSCDKFEDSLIFARRSDDTYALEVRHPFSLMQAVAVCMSSIYHKTLL